MQDYQDDQEVVRTIKDLKVFASQNWWGGFVTGIITLIAVLSGLVLIGLHSNI